MGQAREGTAELFPVRVGSENDTECHCLEKGSDGTTAHSSIVGVARAELPNLVITAVFCENHRKNYEHWKQIEREEHKNASSSQKEQLCGQG